MFEHYQGSQVESYLNYGLVGLIVGVLVLLYYLGKDEKSEAIYTSSGTYASAKIGTSTQKPTSPTLSVGGKLG